MQSKREMFKLMAGASQKFPQLEAAGQAPRVTLLHLTFSRSGVSAREVWNITLGVLVSRADSKVRFTALAERVRYLLKISFISLFLYKLNI
jgi:hypothetical protein